MKAKYRVLREQGKKCPRCKTQMQVRTHLEITSKQLRQAYYYEKWYRCMNESCLTTQVNPPEFKVMNPKQQRKKQDWEEIQRQNSFLQSI